MNTFEKSIETKGKRLANLMDFTEKELKKENIRKIKTTIVKDEQIHILITPTSNFPSSMASPFCLPNFTNTNNSNNK